MRKMSNAIRDWYESARSEAVFEEFEDTMNELAVAEGLLYSGEYSTQNGNGMYEVFLANSSKVDGWENMNYGNSVVTEYDHVDHCEELIVHGGKATAKKYFSEILAKHKEELGV